MTLQNLPLHKIYRVNSQIEVIRVPGGWIYMFYSRKDDKVDTTFVPLSAEFKEEIESYDSDMEDLTYPIV
jgi:hypothetical protein